MTHPQQDAPPSRRAFLGRAAVAAAAVTLAGAPASLLAAARPRRAPAPSDEWLKKMVGKHRQIFDMPQPAGGLPMIHVRNYLNTYESAYGVKHPDVSAAAGLYFMTVPLAFTDEMWAKYELGKAANVMDAETNAPAVRNVFWKPRGGTTLPVGGGPVPLPNDAAMTELQKRGTVYLLCNNAFNFWAGTLAKATNQTPEAVRAELEAHLIPDIHIVPAMVIAYNLAQENGITYMFLP